MLKTKYFIFFLSFFSSILFFEKTFAFTLNYGYIDGWTSSGTPKVYVNYSNNASSTNYACAIYSARCKIVENRFKANNSSSDLSTSSLEIFQNIKDSSTIKNPFITFSNNQKYVVYIKFSTSTGYREIILRNNLDNTEIVISSSTRPWDLLTEHNKLFKFNSDDTRLYFIDDKLNQRSQLFYIDIANPKKIILLSDKEFMVDDFDIYSTSTLIYNANLENHEYNWILFLKENRKPSLKISDWTAHNMGVDLLKNTSFLTFYTTENINRIANILDVKTLKVYKYKNQKAKENIIFLPEEKVKINDEINGIFIKPKNNTKRAVIWLHGGPYRQSGYGLHSYKSYAMYDSILQELAKNNVAVLKVDFHGGWGRGYKFADNIRANVGNLDVQDVKSAIKYLNKKGYTDIVVSGSSYGGYLALKIGTEKDIKITGVLSASPVSDWYTIIDKDPDPLFGILFNGKPTTTNINLYDKANIYNFVDEYKNKNLILIHGTKDLNVGYRQSEKLHNILAEKNINHQFITLKDEPHIYIKPISKEIVCEAFFELAKINLINNDSCIAE